MIQNKFSALIGFGLFLYTLVTLLVFVGLVQVNTFFAIVGGLNLILNGFMIVKVYNHYKIKE